MAEPSTHINYSFEDIQRYLQGKMSAAEMHAIEKAALQDSFLADAIEGFNEADLTTAQQHLNEINTSLFKEKKQSKVVAFNKGTQWMNVAAIIIVLGGIGVVASYFLKSSNQQTQIAQVKIKPSKTDAVKDSAAGSINTLSEKPDTNLVVAENNLSENNVLSVKKKVAKENISTNNKSLEADKTSVATTPPPANQSNELSTMDTAYYNLKSSRSFAASSLSNNNDSVPGILRNKISGINIAPTIFAGKVLDASGQPVPAAVVEAADKSITVVTDNNGDFTLWKSDTVLHAIASTVGFETKITTLKPGENNLIELTRNSSALSDVVVTTALGFSRKPKALAADSATPVGGWQNFNNYVLNKLNKDSTNNNFMSEKDQVEMEFLVDDNGNPYNIKITKPLDEQRNQKAIEILKDGPKWTNVSKKKKAKIAISF